MNGYIWNTAKYIKPMEYPRIADTMKRSCTRFMKKLKNHRYGYLLEKFKGIFIGTKTNSESVLKRWR